MIENHSQGLIRGDPGKKKHLILRSCNFVTRSDRITNDTSMERKTSEFYISGNRFYQMSYFLM